MSLKSIRSKRLLSQEDLAKLSGLNVRTIQRIENGDKPSVESLKCLAAALEEDVAALDAGDSPEAETVDKAKAMKIILLLAVGAVLAILGSGIANGEQGIAAGAAPILVFAGICFLGAALKMLKHRLY